MKSCIKHTNEILFRGKLRKFVLLNVLKHTDLTIGLENLGPLKKTSGQEYTCACPWCGAGEGFSLNKKSGDCLCNACGEEGDLIDLMQEALNEEMTSIIGRLLFHLEQGGEV